MKNSLDGVKTEETYLKAGSSTTSVVGIPEGKQRMNGPKNYLKI